MEGGRIQVSARLEGTELVLEVQDDGMGPDATRRRPGAGMALANVRERLQVQYGTAATLTLTPADPGMRATIRMPYRAGALTMTTVLIADDEPHLARALQNHLAHWPELTVVAVARNGLEAAERIAALQPDIAFLDIQMPGLTGLEVAQGIEGATRVVFVTAFDEYAVQAFDQEAVDYVLKPVKLDRLQRTMERVQRALAPAAGAVGATGALDARRPRICWRF